MDGHQLELQMKGNRVWIVVEDEPSLRQMLTAMLLYWNVVPLVFADGNQAMSWIETAVEGLSDDDLPELALLDIRLPGPHGHEIAQRLRHNPKTADMTLVMMTAYRIDAIEQEQIERMARPDLLIKKPLPMPDAMKSMIDAARDARLSA